VKNTKVVTEKHPKTRWRLYSECDEEGKRQSYRRHVLRRELVCCVRDEEAGLSDGTVTYRQKETERGMRHDVQPYKQATPTADPQPRPHASDPLDAGPMPLAAPAMRPINAARVQRRRSAARCIAQQ
jgi:hypothetical protein